MTSPDPQRLFDEANRLWFDEGATAEALALYRAAALADPTDPAIAFQLARVLWSVGREAEAHQLVGVVERNVDASDEWGRRLVGELASRIAASPPPVSFEPDALDAHALEHRGLAPEQWFEVARAARERGMFGLAARALGRSSGSFRVIELDEDQRDMERAADRERNDLAILDELRRGNQ